MADLLGVGEKMAQKLHVRPGFTERGFAFTWPFPLNHRSARDARHFPSTICIFNNICLAKFARVVTWTLSGCRDRQRSRWGIGLGCLEDGGRHTPCLEPAAAPKLRWKFWILTDRHSKSQNLTSKIPITYCQALSIDGCCCPPWVSCGEIGHCFGGRRWLGARLSPFLFCLWGFWYAWDWEWIVSSCGFSSTLLKQPEPFLTLSI